MAILSKEDFINRIQAIVGEDVSDESLELIEDLTDTYNDLEVKVTSSDTEDWKTKYEQNDNEWRNKYKERFFSNGVVEEQVDEIIDEEIEERDETIKIDDLFEEG